MILLHKKLIALSILYPVFAEVLKAPIKLFLFAKSLRIVVSSLSSSDCKSALFSTKIVGRGFPSKNCADLSTAFFHFNVLKHKILKYYLFSYLTDFLILDFLVHIHTL